MSKESITKRKWNKSDLKKFDRLVSMMDSRDQLERINGRLYYWAWAADFSEAQLAEMWELIKDKK